MPVKSRRPLSHFGPGGEARMVDVAGKATTLRRAVAGGRITVGKATLRAIAGGTVPKGNPFEVARIAGISAAKKTAELIPLCHPLRLTSVDVDIAVKLSASVIEVSASVSAEEKTGVEMEALVGCTVALLTIYDMLKAIDTGMVISEIRLLEKTGGKSDFRRVK